MSVVNIVLFLNILCIIHMQIIPYFSTVEARCLRAECKSYFRRRLYVRNRGNQHDSYKLYFKQISHVFYDEPEMSFEIRSIISFLTVSGRVLFGSRTSNFGRSLYGQHANYLSSGDQVCY